MWLGIETSSLVSSVALVDETRVIGEITMQAGFTHSEQLVPHIDALFNMTGKQKSDLTGIVVSTGPGSFTGLRIGMGTAKAMAYALNIPLYGVMTMDGMAYNLPYCEGIISVLIDAQKKNVYEARYEWQDNSLICTQLPMVKAAVDPMNEVVADGHSITFIGDGIKRITKLMPDDTPHIRIAPMTATIPKASSLVLAAMPQIEAGETENPMTMVPYYIRRSEAEVVWEEKHKDNVDMLVQNSTVIVIETVKTANVLTSLDDSTYIDATNHTGDIAKVSVTTDKTSEVDL